MSRHLIRAALAALLVPFVVAARPAIASAAPGPDPVSPSAFAIPMPGLSGPDTAIEGFAPAAPALASGFAVAPPDEHVTTIGHAIAPVNHSSAFVRGSRYDASRYRPRRERSHSRWRGRGVSQLHAGFLDPEGPSDPGFLAGFRGGQRIDDVFEIGLGLDWRNKSGRDTELIQETVGPGGEIITVRREVSRYSSNLFPALLYVQLSGPSHLALVPYVGAAASWQVLFLEGDDFASGQSFDATFDGFGWQLWGGAAFPLSGRSRLVGEIFMNQAELHRDVYDSFLGQDIRETVSADGVGARFGISWGF